MHVRASRFRSPHRASLPISFPCQRRPSGAFKPRSSEMEISDTCDVPAPASSADCVQPGERKKHLHGRISDPICPPQLERALLSSSTIHQPYTSIRHTQQNSRQNSLRGVYPSWPVAKEIPSLRIEVERTHFHGITGAWSRDRPRNY